MRYQEVTKLPPKLIAQLAGDFYPMEPQCNTDILRKYEITEQQLSEFRTWWNATLITWFEEGQGIGFEVIKQKIGDPVEKGYSEAFIDGFIEACARGYIEERLKEISLLRTVGVPEYMLTY